MVHRPFVYLTTLTFLFFHAPSLGIVYHFGLKAPLLINAENVKCIYHGVCLPLQDHHCTLPETAQKPFFPLIITPKISFSGKQTLAYPQRVPEAQCLWFNLTLEYDNQEQQGYSWKIEKLKHDNMPLRIPEDAIVVQLPPALIQSVESYRHKGKLVLHLPQIILKKDLTQEELDQALDEIALNDPEVNVYCSRQLEEKQHYGTTVISQAENR